MEVFEIERYATEDGPGIRTVIFLKGCNLHCIWCQNPESQEMRPQVMYYQKQCVGCKKCVEACPTGSVQLKEPFGFISDPATCTLCGACVDACFYDARKIIGESWPVEDLFKEVLKDKAFFDESGGGVTFSGGEPMLQAEEIAELAGLLKAEEIPTAVETAGYVKWGRFEPLLPLVDLFYIDLKHIDPQQHRRYTGVPNELILENIKKLTQLHTNVVVRIPVIPGVNDTQEVMTEMFRFLAEEAKAPRVELLPYHRLGMAKYQGLGREYKMRDAENVLEEACDPFADLGRSMGIAVSIGAE